MLSIPIINNCSTDKNRHIFLSELKRAKADRVFMFTNTRFASADVRAKEMKLLSDNIKYYTENGLEVGIWVQGFGHGGALAHETKLLTANYTRIVGLGNGGTSDDSFCPADPGYFKAIADEVCSVARAGARMIMIDDDLRLALHGPVGLGCACERHLAMFNERAKAAGETDHDMTREELAAVLFTGKANPLRRIWLELMGDTLRTFAKDLRAALDTVDPTVRLSLCACLPTWDVDGVDSLELAKLFAGSTKPFLRLIGAPYWNDMHTFHTFGLGSIINLERMQLAWCRESGMDIEVFSEGDAYPRPRFNVPESYLEGFDQVLLAEGISDGILKYMNDYTANPEYEPGYIDRHAYFDSLRRELKDAFAGKKCAGVYIFEAMHKLHDADCTGLSESEIVSRFTPASLNFANQTSLPVSFTRNEYTKTAIVFGENAKYIDDETAKMPLILDSVAAQILTDRGMDVGLDKSDGNEYGFFYTNADGISYLLYPYCAEEYRRDPDSFCRQNWKRYEVQAKLFDSVNRMAECAIPAAVTKDPGAYVLCKKSDGEMAVGIWNFGTDYLMPQKITLDCEYSEIIPIGDTKAVLDGKTASVGGIVPPFCFAGFIVKK